LDAGKKKSEKESKGVDTGDESTPKILGKENGAQSL